VGIVWYFYSWKATLTRYELGAAWLGQPGLLGDYVIGLLFSTNIVAFSALPNIAVLTTRKIAMSIQWIAGATFTVYLFHLPLAQFFVAVFPDRTLGVPLRVWLLPATFLSLLLIAEWSERNKKFWVRLFKRITDSSYLGAP
jgi:peptidoglycan/LPS O-acetylase OafA/YrhL